MQSHESQSHFGSYCTPGRNLQLQPRTAKEASISALLGYVTLITDGRNRMVSHFCSNDDRLTNELRSTRRETLSLWKQVLDFKNSWELRIKVSNSAKGQQVITNLSE